MLSKGIILHLREIFVNNSGVGANSDQNKGLLTSDFCLNRQDFYKLLAKYSSTSYSLNHLLTYSLTHSLTYSLISVPSTVINTIFNKLDVNNVGSFNFIQFIDFLIASESSALYTEMAYTG